MRLLSARPGGYPRAEEMAPEPALSRPAIGVITDFGGPGGI